MKAEWTNKDVLAQSETTGQNKAVLVLDEMPKSCDDCVLIYPDKYNDMWCCIACDCVVEENKRWR